MARYRVGVDVGGTFTDIVFMSEAGEVTVKKVLSTPEDYSEAILEGIGASLADRGLEGRGVEVVVHGTTIATNAILTQSGARTGLITTRGFRDVLEFGRIRRPRLYDMEWERPAPLVPRYLRMEVDERVASDGEVLVPLDMASLASAVSALSEKKVDSIAVCLINSYQNPAHEAAIGRYLAGEAPGVLVNLSSVLLPEIKEFERTSTTVVNAYVQPVVRRYLESFARRLEGVGVECPLLVMQSNGGVTPALKAADQPIHIIESGPAAGVIGALFMAQQTGMGNMISFDMGGTTAKACIIEKGEVSKTNEYEVGAGLNIGHRMLKGGGHVVRVPILDIAEVGAGGGSIAWIAPGGILKVGPQSAGASPGPVCYGRGGSDPTVTDANVALGYLNPDHLAGGTLRLDADAARRSLHDRIARPLGLDLVEAAYGIHLISNATMVRAVRAVSIERGRDPRRFALSAFGGSGPVHAAHLAQEMGMSDIIVPPAPGLFSSLGLLFSDLEHYYVRTFWKKFAGTSVEEVNGTWGELVIKAYEDLEREGYRNERARIQAIADVRYVGQNSDLGIALPDGSVGIESFAQLREAFEQEHQQTYGYRVSDSPVQFVNLRVIARGQRETAQTLRNLTCSSDLASPSGDGARQRRTYFGPALGWIETAAVGRHRLDGGFQEGPLLIEEYDSTTVVPPRCRARKDEWGNIVLEVRRH
jgi:N-methylhydantoinase A